MTMAVTPIKRITIIKRIDLRSKLNLFCTQKTSFLALLGSGDTRGAGRFSRHYLKERIIFNLLTEFLFFIRDSISSEIT